MSRNPGRVVADIAIDLPRPRTIDVTDTPAFVDSRRRIRQLLGSDVEARG
jgi:NitT/TauT family transport system ATP-binding protein